MEQILSKFITGIRKERTLKRAELFNEELHKFAKESMSKDEKRTYQDCVNSYILLKLSELHEFDGMIMSMND